MWLVWGTKIAYRILVGKHLGKLSHGIPRKKGEDCHHRCQFQGISLLASPVPIGVTTENGK